MNIYDDKTKGVIESNGRFVLPSFKNCDEATFKASYVIVSDMKCTGKVTAFFDLTVLGNVEAAELDVKGKFVCTGNCVVSGTLLAQYDIWADDIRAKTIESHDRIIAQEIDADVVKADGDIIVGKCLAVEKLAHSGNNIICGETAYGSGKVAANTVITGEPIDLDDGLDAVIKPNVYGLSVCAPVLAARNEFPISVLSDFAASGDWSGYLDWLIENAVVASAKERFMSWKVLLSKADKLIRTGIADCRDLTLLIWIVDIASSDYFSDWPKVRELLKAVDRHFVSVVTTDKASVLCPLQSYSELLQALNVLNCYGDSMDRTVYGVAFEMLISNFGLRSKFLSERLSEKGWNAHG